MSYNAIPSQPLNVIFTILHQVAKPISVNKQSCKRKYFFSFKSSKFGKDLSSKLAKTFFSEIFCSVTCSNFSISLVALAF